MENNQDHFDVLRKIQKKREDVRELLDFKKKTIVLCAGGTEAGKFLIKQTIDAMEKISKKGLRKILSLLERHGQSNCQ